MRTRISITFLLLFLGLASSFAADKLKPMTGKDMQKSFQGRMLKYVINRSADLVELTLRKDKTAELRITFKRAETKVFETDGTWKIISNRVCIYEKLKLDPIYCESFFKTFGGKIRTDRAFVEITPSD